MRNRITHAGLYSNAEFFETSMTQGNSTLRYRQFVEAFAQAPATGVIAARVTQLDGAASECGPRLLESGFE